MTKNLRNFNKNNEYLFMAFIKFWRCAMVVVVCRWCAEGLKIRFNFPCACAWFFIKLTNFLAFWKWPKSIQIPMDTCDLTWPFKNRLSGHYLDHLKSSLVRVFFKILVPFRIFKNPCTCTWFFIKFDKKPWVGAHVFY